jgi:hypothetical protein
MFRNMSIGGRYSCMQFPPDEHTAPGHGLGIYSAGYEMLVKLYRKVADAAISSVAGDWRRTGDILEEAVRLEHHERLGYTEPPRWVMPLRPCFAVALLLAESEEGDKLVEVVSADLAEYPSNFWGHQVQSNKIVAACKLLLGDPV